MEASVRASKLTCFSLPPSAKKCSTNRGGSAPQGIARSRALPVGGLAAARDQEKAHPEAKPAQAGREAQRSNNYLQHSTHYLADVIPECSFLKKGSPTTERCGPKLRDQDSFSSGPEPAGNEPAPTCSYSCTPSIHRSRAAAVAKERSSGSWTPRTQLPGCRTYNKARRRSIWALQAVVSEAEIQSASDEDENEGSERLQEDGGIPTTYVSAPGRRVLAVGDLHGDLEKTKLALRLAGLLDMKTGTIWTGGTAVLVQVGDVLDRGDDEIGIMSLLRHLERQARKCGGAIYQLAGNHETMNVYGDLRYVTVGGYVEADLFQRWAASKYSHNFLQAFDNWYKERSFAKAELGGTAAGPWNPIGREMQRRNRLKLFEPGGPLACVLAAYSTVLQVNDTLFAHGGVLPQHVEYGLERLNREVSRWMLGAIDEETGEMAEQPFLATRGYNSVMWSRLYSKEKYDSADEKAKACAVLASAIRHVEGCTRVIVGHTPQALGVNSVCNKQVWRIDVGMSSGIMDAPPEVIEIVGSEVRVLRDERASPYAPIL